jgi:hypothetical protein
VYNTSRGADGGVVRWSGEFLDARLKAAVLRYLAVAHFGRGRGDYLDSEYPPHWKDVVARAAELHAERAHASWRQAVSRIAASEAPFPVPGFADELRGILAALTIDVLERLYPGALDDRFRGGLRASSASTNTST